MANILIVFGSTTGNTESVARQIAIGLSSAPNTVTVKNVSDTKVEELGNGYDLTILGASTWGDDEIEFQEDFEPFFQEMDSADIKGRKIALFGCGDSSYQFFCGAVDLLEDKINELGASLIHEPLKIDGDPQGAQADIDSWIKIINDALRQ
jgi:flavodoxin short chain